jgi:hypothetical protein
MDFVEQLGLQNPFLLAVRLGSVGELSKAGNAAEQSQAVSFGLP